MAMESIIYDFIASEISYRDQALIYEEGTTGDWIYVVLKGRVKMKKKTRKGTAVIATLKEGDVFGELNLFEDVNLGRAETVVADGPVKVGIFDTASLVNELNSASPRLQSLLKALVLRLRDTMKNVSLVAT